jgi:predicted dehydrogenase
MTSQPQKLRHAVIGAASGIFSSHRPALKLPEVELVAVADVNVEKGQERAQECGVPFYQDYRQMLAEVQPDVTVILTPPFLHKTMTLDAFAAGSHVLIEKPIATEIAEADAMLTGAEAAGKLLGVTFQRRQRPGLVTAHKLIQDGVLGDIQRIEMVCMWPRPTSYFKLASWRATWAGEGGGVLTNQGSHNLDALCYLVGLPTRIYAWTRRLLHNIETEDTVQAILEWSNGALGSLHLSTAQADDAERIKIVGTRGQLTFDGREVRVWTLDRDMHDYAVHETDPYGKNELRPYTYTLEPGTTDHVSLYRAFHAAIADPRQPYSTGYQARGALELANAIIFSQERHCEVELPLDAGKYAELLAELRLKQAR